MGLLGNYCRTHPGRWGAAAWFVQRSARPTQTCPMLGCGIAGTGVCVPYCRARQSGPESRLKQPPCWRSALFPHSHSADPAHRNLLHRSPASAPLHHRWSCLLQVSILATLARSRPPLGAKPNSTRARLFGWVLVASLLHACCPELPLLTFHGVHRGPVNDFNSDLAWH